MTKNELMELAAQAGIAVPAYRDHIELLTKFADLVAAKEREACAKVCESRHANGNYRNDTRHDCADAIRERGNT